MNRDDASAEAMRNVQRSINLFHLDRVPENFWLSDGELVSDIFNALSYQESYHLVAEVVAILPEASLPALRRAVERTLLPGSDFILMILWHSLDPELMRAQRERLLPICQRLAMLFSRHLVMKSTNS